MARLSEYFYVQQFFNENSRQVKKEREREKVPEKSVTVWHRVRNLPPLTAPFFMSAPRQGEDVILALSSGHVHRLSPFLDAFGFSQGIELS